MAIGHSSFFLFVCLVSFESEERHLKKIVRSVGSRYKETPNTFFLYIDVELHVEIDFCSLPSTTC